MFIICHVFAQQSGGKLPVSGHTFIVSAHRGDHSSAPENTLAAFSNAIADGVDYIEIDLRTTKDSQLVIMHDASVDRMTTGKGLIREMGFGELKKLNVLDKNHTDWGSFEIPTFRQVLELSKGKVNIYLDFKNADAAQVWSQICEFGMQHQVIVYINQEKQIADWRRVAPEMPLMVSLPDQVKDSSALIAFLDKTHIEIIDGDYDQYNADMVRMANGKGVMVFPDIQRPGEMAAIWDKAISIGIRALQTDHPKELIAYLVSKKWR
jgi:glycerophosphoryl diester phosphodiesterase